MNNLKKLRKLNNLTQTEIAKIIGVEQGTYGKYERGEIPLNFEYAKKLSEYYKVSISYLLDSKNKDITITIQQYQDLLKARDTINNIEKAYNTEKTINENYGIININGGSKKQ